MTLYVVSSSGDIFWQCGSMYCTKKRKMPCQTEKDHHSVKIKECFATRFTRRMNDAKVDNFSSEIWRGIQNLPGRRSQPFCEVVQQFSGGAHCLLFINIEHHRR